MIVFPNILARRGYDTILRMSRNFEKEKITKIMSRKSWLFWSVESVDKWEDVHHSRPHQISPPANGFSPSESAVIFLASSLCSLLLDASKSKQDSPCRKHFYFCVKRIFGHEIYNIKKRKIILSLQKYTWERS